MDSPCKNIPQDSCDDKKPKEEKHSNDEQTPKGDKNSTNNETIGETKLHKKTKEKSSMGDKTSPDGVTGVQEGRHSKGSSKQTNKHKTKETNSETFKCVNGVNNASEDVSSCKQPEPEPMEVDCPNSILKRKAGDKTGLGMGSLLKDLPNSKQGYYH